MPKHLTFFRIVKPARKITFYYSMISRMPQFCAMWSKSRQAVVCNILHSICPDTSPYSKLSNQPEKSLLLFTDINNAPVWCYVAQKQAGGSLQHSLGGVQQRDQPPINSSAQIPLLFQNCQTSQKNQFYYSLISRMPQFGAMWSKSRQAVVCSIPQVEYNHGINP